MAPWITLVSAIGGIIVGGTTTYFTSRSQLYIQAEHTYAAAIRFWNYALYCGAIAAAVLILVDLPQPSNYGAEGDRVLWTLCGVGIGVLVMFLAGLLARRTAKAPPQPATQPA